MLLSVIAFAAAGFPPSPQDDRIATYHPRFGRKRPVVAVVASNAFTEITDFMIPFGTLSRSGVADVMGVSTGPGIVEMPPLRVRLQGTLDQFDARYPQGADYVIVPYVTPADDPVLVKWIAAQNAKGGALMSVCLGATVVAGSGLLDGRRAATWFGSEPWRDARYPKVRWQKNVRYLSDGGIISTAGISASLPASIALVEAIGGRRKADALAKKLGVGDWSAKHDSDAFSLRPGETLATGRADSTAETVGLPLKDEIDEIALGFTADAFSHTGHSRVVLLSPNAAAVRTRHGLTILADGFSDGLQKTTRLLPPLSSSSPAKALDRSLETISQWYGRAAAYVAARMMEYPGFPEKTP